MNNFELHDAATELADSASNYELAKRIITQDRYIAELEQERDELKFSNQYDKPVKSRTGEERC